MNDRNTDIDRLRFNLLMAFGLLWITLTGGCSAWFLVAAALDWLNNATTRGLATVTFLRGASRLTSKTFCSIFVPVTVRP